MLTDEKGPQQVVVWFYIYIYRFIISTLFLKYYLMSANVKSYFVAPHFKGTVRILPAGVRLRNNYTPPPPYFISLKIRREGWGYKCSTRYFVWKHQLCLPWTLLRLSPFLHLYFLLLKNTNVSIHKITMTAYKFVSRDKGPGFWQNFPLKHFLPTHFLKHHKTSFMPTLRHKKNPKF